MSLANRVQSILDKRIAQSKVEGPKRNLNPWCADATGRRFDGLVKPFCKIKYRGPETHQEGSAGGPWDIEGYSPDNEITCCGDEEVLCISGYSSLFTIEELPLDYPSTLKFILVLDEIRLSSQLTGSQLKGFLGQLIAFEMKLRGNLMIGEFCGPPMAKKELTLRFQLFDCAKNEQLYFRLTRSETSVGPLLESLSVIFLDNVGVHKRATSGMKGPNAKSIEERLVQGVKACTTLTPFCLPLEIEQLAAWSLLRMIEINEAPKAGGFDRHSTFLTSPNRPAGTRDDERVVVVPSMLKSLSNSRKRGEARCVPLSYLEFLEELKKVNSRFEGSLKDLNKSSMQILRHNSAICALMDSNHGYIPLALKAALFLTPPVPERKIIEVYHREIFTFDPLNLRSVNIFTRTSPADGTYSIFTFGLKNDLEPIDRDTSAVIRSVPVLERFDAVETRVAEPRYWYYLDSVTPRKNRVAADFALDNFTGTQFPLPSQLVCQNSIDKAKVVSMSGRLRCDGFEIAPGVLLYMEKWPNELRSASLWRRMNNEPLFCVALLVKGHMYYSITGVSKKIISFIISDWLPLVPMSPLTKLPI